MPGRQRKDPGDGPPIVAEDAGGVPPTHTPKAPSFVMCEGVRTDLEQTGETVDPFTGKTVTRED